MKTYQYILLLFFFGPIAMHAQIDWKNPVLTIDRHDGLASTYYKDFEEDEYGFLWISTQKDLSRFDGSKLTLIKNKHLPKDGFTDLAYDSKRKVLWIGTHSGLYSYHLITESVSAYKTNKAIGQNQVLSIALGEDQVWIGTRARLAKLDIGKDSIETVFLKVVPEEKYNLSYNEVNMIQIDPVHPELLWMATDGGIIQYNSKTKQPERYHKAIGNPKNLLINQIFVDKTNQELYFGIHGRGQLGHPYNYLRYDAKSKQFIRSFSFNTRWDNRNISSFNDSLILFSTSAGLVTYNHQTDEIVDQSLNEPNSSVLYKVNYIDSKANIWTGTSKNIRMYNTKNIRAKQYYYESAFPEWYHIVSKVDLDRKNNKLYLPVIGGEGLYMFDLTTRKWTIHPLIHPEKEGLSKTDFTEVYQDKEGRIKIIAASGIYELNQEGFVKKTDFSLDGDYKLFMISLVDSHGILWSSCKAGVAKIDLETNTAENISDRTHYCDAYSGESHYYEDQQSNIWIGGYCKGFDVYHRERDQYYSFDITSISTCTSVTQFDERDGFLWAMGDKGYLFKVDLNHPEKGIIETIDFKQMIANKELSLINIQEFDYDYFPSGQFDAQGSFWCITKDGLIKYDPKLGQLERFDEKVGMQVNDPEMNVFVANFLHLLPDGQMAYSTRKGICIFDPQVISNEVEVPRPYISVFSVNNEIIKADSSSFFKRHYSLSPVENFVGFDFSALAFSNALNLQFSYKLEGVDEDWKNPGDKRFVSYTQLKGGDYTFLLKTSNTVGIWQDQPIKVGLSIAKFWYNTAWAKGLFLAALVFGILFTYFSRLNQAIEKEHVKFQYERDLAELKMQALTAQMNPHFIFNSLNSIDYYIIKNDTKKASNYLNRFSRLIRLILKNSRSNYISLKDDVDALKLYLEIEALRFNHKFDYEIKINEEIDADYIKIPPMLIQPYVENSIWHGLLHKRVQGKIIIEYDLDHQNELIKCTIRDNGIGRKKSMEAKAKKGLDKQRKSFGMNITKDKIEAINFLHDINTEVKITDLYDQQNEGIGTQVELSIPI